MIRVSSALLLAGLFTVLFMPQSALAHRSGCHNLHTCPSDSDSYVCGDLGYPCTGATSLSDIPVSAIHVPLAVEAIFRETFDRKPTDAESNYWKRRFRSDKDSVYKLRRAMAWHKAQGSFGPPAAARSISPTGLARRINALFREANDGRNPTVSENQYWITRIPDKPTEDAMRGAMLYHRLHAIQH